MLYGREPRLPQDIGLTPPGNLSPSVAEHREKIVSNLQRAYQIAHENTQRAQQAMKVYYDRAAKDPNFQVGERVWVFTPQLNPITYGGGFLARTIRLSTTTLKRLYLAPPNLVTFCFYLLDTLWQNFSKIDLPGGLLQLFLK